MTALPASLTLPTDATPIAVAADLYVSAGLPPIPLWGLRPDGACMCPAGNDCPPRNRGKHPVGSAWQKRATLDADAVRDMFRNHRGNIGVYLALGGHVLVDADGEGGLEIARSWNMPPTLTQQSGSGQGAHYIFRLAPHQDSASITDRRVAGDDAGHVDVKVRGQFAAAPSRHGSGGQYRWIDARPVATLPDWLYEKIRKPRREVAAPTPSDNRDRLYERARGYIEKIPAAISGSGGHDQTFAAARALAGWLAKGLPEQHCWGLLCEYNARCEPPWSEKELGHKWDSAKKAHSVPMLPDRPRPNLRVVRPGETPGPTSEAATASADDWRQELMYSTSRSGQQKLIDHADNIVRILQLDPRWKGKIAFNSFAQEIVCATDLPWDDYHKPTESLSYWTDQDGTRLAAWLRREWQRYSFDPTVTDCERAVDVVARGHAFHPVRDYLDSVPWDGVQRLAHWPSTYLGAEDTEYHRTVGRWWLISAVARIYEPGCKVDTVPILEGHQGKRKSTAIGVLAGEWFSDAEIDVTSKDAAMAIQGCWLVELAEVDSLMRAEPSEAKRFFSRPSDRFRPPWGRRIVVLPRQCVFVGTTNLREYLADPTGARRYLPIACGTIDIDALRRDRDQLWAEACHEYREGRRWYPESETDAELLRDQQAARTSDDSWETTIAAYLSTRKRVTSAEILESALELAKKDWTRPTQMRVGAIMAKIGWERRKSRLNGQLVWGYFRPGSFDQ